MGQSSKTRNGCRRVLGTGEGRQPATCCPSVGEPRGRRQRTPWSTTSLSKIIYARAIARHLGWGLNTVLRYANAPSRQDTFRENGPVPAGWTPTSPTWSGVPPPGCTSVTHLHNELLADKAPVTDQMVRAHIAVLSVTPAGTQTRPPTVRQVGGWLTRHPTRLSEDDQTALKDILACCPELGTAAGHIRDFGEIPTDRLGATLPKKIKRQLYGRAGFHLLRKVILLQ